MAVKKKEVDFINWTEYFASIVAVCPWSKAFWAKQKIDIKRWRGERNITPLGDYVARMWLHPNASGRTLCKIHYRLNNFDNNEEWLYSHPQYGRHSTPTPVLIQQNATVLNNARKQNGKVYINNDT